MQATTDAARGLVSGEGEAIWFLGSLVTVKTGGEETDEAFSIAEHVYPAGFRDAGVPAADRTAPTPAATGADIKWKLATVPRYGIEFPPPPGGRNGKDCVAPTGRMPRILAGPTDPPGPRRRS